MDDTLELFVTREGTTCTVKAKSTLGEKSKSFELPSLTFKINKISDAINEQEPLTKEFVTAFGAQLFNLLFSGIPLHECLEKSDHLTIVLHTDDPVLNEIPWELCYDPEYKTFLGADPQCSFVRRDQQSTKSFDTIDYPLKVLVIVSSPINLDEQGEYQPDPDEIITLMEPLNNLERKGMIHLDFLERASVKHIQDHVKEGYHIVHFIGHGYYDGKTGHLIIEDKHRNAKELEEREVAALFGVNPPHLLILTACESAPLIPFLLSKKIPAVLAMQYTVLKDIAHEFVERFYALLVKGDTLPKAVSTARSAVLIEEGIENPGWFTPVLVVRTDTILTVNTDSDIVIPEKEQFDVVPDLIGVKTFVGRRKDLWLIEKALFEDDLNMVIIKGIGGIGKTALASKFVEKNKGNFRGVFAKRMVDPEMGAEEVLALLDQFLLQYGEHQLHEVIAEPDLNVKIARLLQCLKGNYLLILDNVETLIKDGTIADKGIEQIVQALLYGSHNSKVVITTRYGFTFTDEKGSSQMRIVDLQELSFQFAVQLLEKCGIKEIETRARIYEKIGGNPQFLEFFVKLKESRSVEGLLQDVTPVREKVGDWLLTELVGLLNEEEVNGLKKVSVFRVKVDKDAFAVLGVCDAVIDRLVYYSLVTVDAYYSMHQGVKEYVYGLLDNERIGMHGIAAQYYERLVEKEKDLEDILEWHYHLVASEQYEKAGNLVLGLSEPFLRWGYWGKLMELLMQTVKTTDRRTKAGGLHNLGMVLESFGNYTEAEKLYKESLAIAKNIGDTAGIAISLHQLGIIQEYQGNYTEAEKLYKESLAIKKNIGDTAGIAASLGQLGIIQEYQGNYTEAEKLYKEALAIKKNIGDTAGIAISLHQLGRIQEYQGNYTEAEKLYKESLAIAKNIGDTAGIAISLHQLGIIQEYQGNYTEAEKLYKESLAIKKNIGDTAGIARSLGQLGIIQEYQGNYTEAEKLYKESLAIAKNIGDTAGIAASLHQLGMIQEYQGNYTEAEKLYKESLAIAKNIGDTAGIAISLHQLGIIQEYQGTYTEAVEYYIPSLSIFSQIGSPHAETVIKSLNRVRKTMGKEHFDTLWKTITNQDVPDYIISYQE